MSEVLFRSSEIEVRRVAAGDGRVQVATFDCYHDVEGTERAGFGQAFLAERGVTAIHVLTRGNDWFQYAETPTALEVVANAMAQAERRIAYGSSMGGYGAIRFAAAIGAHAALALSPQYSVDPRRSRFETRWTQDRQRIRFRPMLERPIRPGPRFVVAYDPSLAADRAHVARIAAEVPVEPIAVPFAGHPAGPFLSDCGLLAPLIEDLLADCLDLARFREEAHARRKQSVTWLGQLGTAQPPWRRRTAVWLARRAAEQSPDSPAVLDRLALCLRSADLLDEAVAAHRTAIALEPLPAYLWNLGQTLSAAGRTQDALDVARTLQRDAPHVAGHHRWAAELSLRLGNACDALSDLRRACAEAPRNLGYRWSALRLAWVLRLRRLARL